MISVSTESRFMEPAEAATKVASTVGQCLEAGFRRFYKKIDSTVRGNPGSEIEAFLQTTGQSAALICPAIPRIGRICRDGRIYLNGTPLDQTEIGRDPFNPIATSSVSGLLGQQSSLVSCNLSAKEIESGFTALKARIRSLVRDGVRLIVADALSEAHLLALASQVEASDVLPVGAGGYAWALAQQCKGNVSAGKEARDKPQGPILAVIGSLSSVSRRQADIACQSGRFLPFEIRTSDTREMIERAFRRLLDRAGTSTPNILLRIAAAPDGTRISKAEGERVAALLGDAAAIVCHRCACRTVYSTGGGTSMGVAQALGIGAISLKQEIMPGVVLGSCSAPGTAVRWFISKSGGFGPEDTLRKIADGIYDGSHGAMPQAPDGAAKMRNNRI